MPDISGDGAGCLVAMPHDFLKLIAKQDCDIDLPEPAQYGVAMCFLPNSDKELQKRARKIISETAESLGHAVLGWRKVPTDGNGVGPSALKTEPIIEQLFLSNSSHSTYGKTDVEQQVSSLMMPFTGSEEASASVKQGCFAALSHAIETGSYAGFMLHSHAR